MNTPPQPARRWLIASALLLDGPERTLRRGRDPVPLPPRAFDLLVRLAQAEGRLLGKEQLLDDVWQDRMVEDGTLSRHVWLLRKALGADAALLETVPKAGYRLLGVQALDETPSAAAETIPPESSVVMPPRPAFGARYLVGAGLGLALALSLLLLWPGTLVRQPTDGDPTSGFAEREQAQLLAVRAQALVARRSEADLIEAIQLYRQAVGLAPQEARHHAGLAMALALVSGVALPASSYDSARQSARRALTLQPDHVDALAVLGLVAMNRDRDWPGAENLFRRALAIDPRHVRSLHWLGELLVLLGTRQEEGLAMLQQAHDLAPDEVAITSDLAKAAYFSRQYERAIRSATRAIALDPAFAHSHRWRALARLEVGRCTSALEDARDAVRLDPSAIVRAEQIYVLGRCGQRPQAGELALQLRGESEGGYVSPIALLLVALAVDDRAAALDALEEAVRNGNMVLGVATAPAMDVLRSEPRFVALMAQIGAATTAVSSR